MTTADLGRQIKQKYPTYSKYSDDEIGKRVLQKYPQYKEQVQEPKSVKGLIQNLGTNAKGYADSFQQARQGRMSQIQADVEAGKTPKVYGQSDLIKDVPRNILELAKEGVQFLKNPVDYSYENPLDVLLAAVPTAKAGAKVAKNTVTTTKFVKSPMKTISKKIETKAERAGALPDEAFREKFGTKDNPNMELLDKLTGAGGEADLLKELLHEIVAFESSGGKLTKTFSSALKKRQGLYNEGKAARGMDATPEQQLKQNMARAYSELLKEGAGTGGLDKAYSLLKKLESGKGKAKWGAERAIYTGIGIGVAKKLGLF